VGAFIPVFSILSNYNYLNSMKNITSFIILLSVFGFCSPKSEIHYDIYRYSFKEAEISNIFLSDIASEVKYIPLSNSKVLTMPARIFITANDIILSERNEGIMRFDLNGNYINHIGRKGRGPGEYLTGLHFAINSADSLVYIKQREKIFIYNYSGGFLGQISDTILKRFSTIALIDDLFYFTSPIYAQPNFKHSRWLVTNKDLCVLRIKEDYTVFESSGFTLNESNSYIHNNSLHYWNNYLDTVYNINKTEVMPRLIFNKDKYGINPEIMTKQNIHQRLGDYYIVQYLQETNHFFMLRYIYANQYYIGILNKTDGNSQIANISEEPLSGIANDIDGGIEMYAQEFQIINGAEYFISSVNAYQLKAHVASDAFKNSTPKYPDKKRELEQLANSLSENDNPVLMIVKLKE
jgi:hypothetical protein